MNRVVAQCIAILILLPTCAAQRLHPCKFSGTSGVGHIEGITVQRFAVIEKGGKNRSYGLDSRWQRTAAWNRLLTLSNPRPQQRYRLTAFCMGTGLGREQLQSSLTE